jgi:uncharacterized protein (DUF2147 family)
MKKLLTTTFLIISTMQVKAQSDRIVGVWLTSDKDAKIEIYQKDSRFYGKMIWLTPDVDGNGKPLTDSENPDPTKRNRKLEGIEIISNLAYADGKWKGTIYDPESGKTYSSQIKLVDETTLELTGFIGLPMFGRTETWKRGGMIETKLPSPQMRE